MPDRFDLRCPACSAVVSYGPKEMAARLRQAGKLRRVAEPEIEILAELFTASAATFACDSCAAVGLVARPAAEDDSDWGGSRACEVCGKPIPAERVELFPHIKVCVTCQGKSESGRDTADAEYCPRCGAIMKLRQSRGGGVTRYAMSCPECGR